MADPGIWRSANDTPSRATQSRRFEKNPDRRPPLTITFISSPLSDITDYSFPAEANAQLVRNKFGNIKSNTSQLTAMDLSSLAESDLNTLREIKTMVNEIKAKIVAAVTAKTHLAVNEAQKHEMGTIRAANEGFRQASSKHAAKATRMIEQHAVAEKAIMDLEDRLNLQQAEIEALRAANAANNAFRKEASDFASRIAAATTNEVANPTTSYTTDGMAKRKRKVGEIEELLYCR
ncbi:hypothetical protein VTK26DRAFT_8629 [Humicola hyalothermophila]